MRVAGIVWNTLKGCGIEKSGVETKVLKRRQAGLSGGCLKNGGLEPPYELCLILFHDKMSYTQTQTHIHLFQTPHQKSQNNMCGSMNLDIPPNMVSA